MPENDSSANVTIIGCGPGNPDYLLPAAMRAAATCRVLFGSGRLLAMFADLGGEKREIGGDFQKVVKEIVARAEQERVGVLVSGDPGCFSLAGLVQESMGKKRCRIIPGISSVQLAAARLGLAWTEISVFSLHGRSGPDLDEVLDSKNAFILLGSDLSWLITHWEILGTEFVCTLCRDLGLPGEEVIQIREVQGLHLQAGASELLVLEKK